MLVHPDYAEQVETLVNRISQLEEENGRLKLLEETIARNTALFEALVANSWEGISLIGPDRRIVRVVRSALGYQPFEVSGTRIESLIHPDDREILLDCWNELLARRAKSVEFEGRIRNPDGSYGWVLARLTDMLDDPNVQAIVCNCAHVTERKRHELVRAEFDAIAESADRAVFSVDLDGVILTWNEGAKKLLGYPSKEVVGRDIAILIPGDLQEEERCMRIEAGQEGRPREWSTMRVHRNGLRMPLQVTLTPVLDRYGRARSFCHVAVPESQK
jgi:PAS domain S-box-containing protein